MVRAIKGHTDHERDRVGDQRRTIEGLTYLIGATLLSLEPDDDYRNLLRNVIHANRDGTRSTHILEEFTVSHARALLPACMDPVKEELYGLIQREVFKVVEKNELPTSAQVLGCRIMKCMKMVGTVTAKY